MRKIIIITIVLFTLTSMLAFYVDKEVKKEQKMYNSYLGKDYILNGDTLQIIDYSGFVGTYKLSNGVEISSKLVVKNKQ